MLGLPVPRRLYDPISHILPFRSQEKPSPTNGDGIARLCLLKQQSGPVMLTFFCATAEFRDEKSHRREANRAQLTQYEID